MSTLRVNTITPQSGSTNQLSGSVLITNALTVNGASAFVNATFTQLLTGTTFSGSAATFSGNVTAATLTGTLQTATQTNITSVGDLTSLTVSGAITSTLTSGIVLTNTSGGTNATQFRLNNTGGDMRIGIESSAGQAIQTGTSAYAAVFGNQANYPTQFTTNGTVRMTLDASGNLGLGVTPASTTQPYLGLPADGIISGAAGLYLANNMYFSNGAWRAVVGGTAGSQFTATAAGFAWLTAPSVTNAGDSMTRTPRMTLDASGNLLVNKTTASYSSANRGLLELNGTNEAWLVLQRNATAGTSGIVRQTSTAMELLNRENTPLIFSTNDTERARITSGGYFRADDAGAYTGINVAHGFRSSAAGLITLVCSHASNPFGLDMSYSAASPNGTSNEFIYLADSTALRASIRSNGGIANYSANNVNLASDFRLKKDIAPLASTWDKLKAIEVVNFRYKDCNEGDPALYGVIAQQVQPIVPELVVVTREAVEAKDAVLDEDGNEVEPAVEAKPEYYGIREQPMYWLAIKALQEAQARIEALEARLEALEA